MNTRLHILFLILVFSLLSCSDKGNYPPEQTSNEFPESTPSLPEEIRYPGMVPFDETAAYDFKSTDGIDIVAKWFESQRNAKIERRTLADGIMYYFTLEDTDIELYQYDKGTHIRYKPIIKKSKRR